jgi:chromosome segregation ATPase
MYQSCHNSKEDNLRFKITSCEGDLRYLLGEPDKHQARIEELKKEIPLFEAELAKLLEEKKAI